MGCSESRPNVYQENFHTLSISFIGGPSESIPSLDSIDAFDRLSKNNFIENNVGTWDDCKLHID